MARVRWHAGPKILGRPSTLGEETSGGALMDMKDIEEGRRRWQERFDASRRREADFTTLPGTEVEPVYGPPTADPRFERIGWPGEFPYTRGLYTTGYRGRAWTIRQFAGFGNARQ